MADVFISYSRRNKEPAIGLASVLTDKGYDVWYDADLLPNTKQFEHVINHEIDQAGGVITIWSEDACKSSWVPYEAKRALKQEKLICCCVEDFDLNDLPADFALFHVELRSQRLIS